MHKGKELPIPATKLSEIMAQFKVDPQCHRHNCHGRGYTGLTIDGTFPILCACATIEETQWVRTEKEIHEILEFLIMLDNKYESHTAYVISLLREIITVQASQHVVINAIENRGFWRTIWRWFKGHK